MPTKFSDQSNFLVAFITVGLGIFTFRNELEKFHFVLFDFVISGYILAILFIAILSLAAYISALAVVSSNLNFIKFPLTKYLEKTATFTSALGLFYPVFVLLVIGVSHIVMTIDFSLLNQDVAQTIVTVLSGAVGLFLAYSSARTKRYRDVEERYIKQITEKIKYTNKNYEFLEHYEFVQAYAREYLQALGYGVRSGSLRFIYNTLYSKGLVQADNLMAVRELTELRNNYAHGRNRPTKAELSKASAALDKINEEINLKFTQLVVNEGSDNRASKDSLSD